MRQTLRLVNRRHDTSLLFLLLLSGLFTRTTLLCQYTSQSMEHYFNCLYYGEAKIPRMAEPDAIPIRACHVPDVPIDVSPIRKKNRFRILKKSVQLADDEFRRMLFRICRETEQVTVIPGYVKD